MDQRLSPAEGNEDVVADVRVVLTGKSGAGKSAAGNTILDAEEFSSKRCWSPVTEQCCRRRAEVGDRIVAVTDTPDLLSAHGQSNDLQAETEECVSLCRPGVHAFLFILNILDTFTRQELDLLSRFEQVFGEDVFRFTVVVFTHGDQLQRRPVDGLIRSNFQLLNLVNRCAGGYHVLNNADRSNRQQVSELLQKIDRMVSGNGNNCYTLQMLQEAERRAEEERERISEEQHREEVRQNRDEEEMEKNKEVKSGRVLVLKCVIVMIFSPAAGCVLMWSKGSADFWTFLSGCAVGASAAVLGAVTGKIWVLMLKSPFRMWCSSPQGSPTAQFLKKLAGVLCGGLLGSVVAHVFTGQAAVSLLAGLAGATGAFITAHCSMFP